MDMGDKRCCHGDHRKPETSDRHGPKADLAMQLVANAHPTRKKS